MPFPYNSNDQLLTEQAILAGVAGVSGGQGVIRVSSLTEVTVALEGDAGSNRVSAIQGDAGNLMVSAKSNDAGTLRMSAIGGTAGDNVIVGGNDQAVSATVKQISAVLSASDNALLVHAVSEGAGRMQISAKSNDGALLRTSAVQEGAGALMVSAKSNDAGTLRMSAIGGTAGDNIIVDGTDQTVSARIKQISAVLSASDNAFIVHTVSEGAGRMQVSAKSNDGALLRASAVQDGAAALNVSAKSNDGALLRTSAIQDGAAALNVSAKSNDAGLLLVSAKQGDAGLLLVSAKQGDAGLFRVSSFQGDAANLNVSAKSNDGALLRTSAVQDGAAALNVSAKSDSANLLRTSSFESAVTTSTGGLSFFATSAGIAQTSAIKSSGGRLYGYHLEHSAGVDQFLVVFNASATTSVTLGTTVPDLYLGVPAGTGANAGAGAVTNQSPGIGFSNGIVVAVVSAPGGNTAGASAMRLNLFYG